MQNDHDLYENIEQTADVLVWKFGGNIFASREKHPENERKKNQLEQALQML